MKLSCPKCQSEMLHHAEPDVEIDVCSACGGRFLDRGELNRFATGLPGDIEARSRAWTDMIYAVEGQLPPDTFPVRMCPVCDDQPMQKIGITCGVDVTLDGCHECGGFFVDRGEIESLNDGLAALAPDKNAEELREMRGEHLVLANKFWGGLAPGGLSGAAATVFYQVVVYYGEPLAMGLHLFREKWLAKVTKALGLYTGEDIVTDDSEFDSLFIIRGQDAARVRMLLSRDVRQLLLRFCRDRVGINSHAGSLEVHDHCVAYGMGPFSASHQSSAIDWTAGQPSVVIDRLVSVARAITNSRREA